MAKVFVYPVRAALAWGRWAVGHRRVARAVYLGVYMVVGLFYWAMFGLWAGVIAGGAMLALTTATLAWARRVRRRRGLPPLPPLWHSRRGS